jgi:hypothetical protein
VIHFLLFFLTIVRLCSVRVSFSLWLHPPRINSSDLRQGRLLHRRRRPAAAVAAAGGSFKIMPAKKTKIIKPRRKM